VDGLRLALGLLLPWALGIALLLAARGAQRRLDAPGELAWLIGAGYLAGAVLLTLWMRALSLAGIPFGVASVGLPLLLVAAALVYLGLRRAGGPELSMQTRAALRVPAAVGRAAHVLWWLVVGWITLRYALLALEVSWRPLYPWDAWIAWATKARVWFEQGRMVPFVDASTWLAGDGKAWFDAEPRNPATLPLLQVWTCIALGRWDDALMNWPWWQMAVALAFVVYGGLRRLGSGAVASLLAAYLVASLPLANVHVALAGYADLPLAAYYTTAVLAFLLWADTRATGSLVAAALFALACPLIKATGLWWALTLLPAFAVVALPRIGIKVAAGAFGVLLFALAVLAQTNIVVAGRSLHLDFMPEWTGLGDSFFIVGTWNLLWYAALGAALLAWRRVLEAALLPLATIIAFGMLLLFVTFAFPGLRAYAADLPTLSRAALHLAPALVVFVALAFRAFAAHWAAAHPPPAAPALAPAPGVTGDSPATESSSDTPATPASAG
jgi:hypothetical protein